MHLLTTSGMCPCPPQHMARCSDTFTPNNRRSLSFDLLCTGPRSPCRYRRASCSRPAPSGLLSGTHTRNQPMTDRFFRVAPSSGTRGLDGPLGVRARIHVCKSCPSRESGRTNGFVRPKDVSYKVINWTLEKCIAHHTSFRQCDWATDRKTSKPCLLSNRKV